MYYLRIFFLLVDVVNLVYFFIINLLFEKLLWGVSNHYKVIKRKFYIVFILKFSFNYLLFYFL